LLVPAKLTVGRLVKLPLPSTAAPDGATGNVKVSVCAGTSGSVATLATLTLTPTLTVWSETGVSDGEVLAPVRLALNRQLHGFHGQTQRCMSDFHIWLA